MYWKKVHTHTRKQRAGERTRASGTVLIHTSISLYVFSNAVYLNVYETRLKHQYYSCIFFYFRLHKKVLSAVGLLFSDRFSSLKTDIDGYERKRIKIYADLTRDEIYCLLYVPYLCTHILYTCQRRSLIIIYFQFRQQFDKLYLFLW